MNAKINLDERFVHVADEVLLTGEFRLLSLSRYDHAADPDVIEV